MKTNTEQGKGYTRDATSTVQEASAILHRYDQLSVKVFLPDYLSLPNLFGNYQKKKYLSIGDQSMIVHSN